MSFVAFMCWYLWKAWNDFYFDNVNSSPLNVIRCVDRAWHNYFNAIESNASQQPSSSNEVRDLSSSTTWIVPSMDVVKINADAALNHLNQGGIAFICRDYVGKPLIAISQRCCFPSIAAGEACAISEGLSRMLQLGHSNIEVEYDNMEVIRMLIRATSQSDIYAFDVVRDVKMLLSDDITVSFSHIHRGANSVAHSLARRALTLTGGLVGLYPIYGYLSHVPLCIIPVTLMNSFKFY
ncbi:hypothetical protein NE237_008623 [Protea cynaroides]|uniref:RNase H type-1 domain-containing protein n=1 Tax=Protea cynaroides TaxID=273540 RepID=A0A9Q0KVW4_9MAGN|nr:hypothetical protein NE237_008623 [Protea cynaroides]